MRKFLIAVLAVLCTVLTGFAFACNKEPVYYILNFNEQPGVTFDFGEIKNGAEVRDGYTVTFTVTFDEGVEGSKEVSYNNEVVKPDENGVYSFVMSEDTLVTASAWLVSGYTVNFDMGVASGDDGDEGITSNENMMWYLDEEGNVIEAGEKPYSGGDVVKFKVKTSVYCSESAGNIRVTANTMVLTPDEDGVYSFTVSDNTNVNVVGLHTDEDMIYRGDGDGSANNPYMLRKPIDLYSLAYYMESTFYAGTFNALNYKLAEDIDLKGEKLYVIGEYPEEGSLAIFCGTFDGDGHTISNYYLDDYIIDQTNGNTVALNNVGMFGVCSATVGAPATIKNLKLENFKININGSIHNTSGYYVGGLVGYGVGVNVVNCSVNGTIEVNGNETYFGNVGGIIGYQQSVYQTQSIKYSSFVRSCSSGVAISCPSGNVYSAGGITGILASAEDSSTSYILDCYSTGNVTGAMFTGGIAGTISAYSSVANCYSTGRISARSVGLVGGSSQFSTAYAGGIVGYASGDSVVSGSAFTGRVPASTATVVSGNIIAGKDAGDDLLYVNTKQAVEYNNAQRTSNINFKSLGWSEYVWDFNTELPTLKENPSYRNIEIKVGGILYPVAGCKSMAEIYENEDTRLPRYMTEGNTRSYGYFFDEELTQAVPLSFVPTGEITLYVGFADYSEVAGKYYFRTGSGSSSVYAELTADGKMLFTNGAQTYETDYTYDGVNVTLSSSPATIIEVTSGSGTSAATASYYVPAVAECKEGELNFTYSIYYNNTLYRYTVVAVEDGYSFSGVYYSGVKGIDGYSEYAFYKDGSGIINNLDRFTYTKDGNKVTIGSTEATLSDNAITINGKQYTSFDNLTGVWVKSADTHESFEFDGKGNWRYKFALYSDTGVELDPRRTAEGTYTLTDGGANLYVDGSEAGTVTVTPEGFLAINYGSITVTYYRNGSMAGTWTYTSVDYPTTVTFYGIGLDGFGKVHISHLSDMYKGPVDENGNREEYKGLDMLYEAIDNTVYIYNGDTLYGRLTYSRASGTLDGEMFLSGTLMTASSVMFCLYDVYYGNWVESTDADTPFESVRFNGLGSYNISGQAGAYSKVAGTVRIGNTSVSYSLTHSLMEGKFTYNGVEYSLSYNAGSDTVVITDGSNTYTLKRAQA